MESKYLCLNCRGGGGGGRRGRPSGSGSKSQAAASNLPRGADKEAPTSGRGGRKPGRGRGSGRGRKPQHMVSLLSQQSILQVKFYLNLDLILFRKNGIMSSVNLNHKEKNRQRPFYDKTLCSILEATAATTGK